MRAKRWQPVAVLFAALLTAAAPRAVGAGPADPGAQGKVAINDEVEAQQDGAVRLVAVVEIAATPSEVFDAVLDFEGRARGSQLIDEASVYAAGGGSTRFEQRVRWKLSVVGIEITYHTVYDCDRGRGRVSWALDEQRDNDIGRAVGEYVVRPSPTRSGHVRLFYDFEVASDHEGPQWLRRQLAKKNVRRLLEDIRRRAEH